VISSAAESGWPGRRWRACRCGGGSGRRGGWCGGRAKSRTSPQRACPLLADVRITLQAVSAETWTVIGVIAAVVAALIAGLAFAWQMRAHRRSGPLVSVESTYAIPVYGPPHAPEFHDDDQVVVSVINRGGAAATVTNYGVEMGRKSGQNMFVIDRPSWATPLPAAVEPGGEPVRVLVPMERLRRAHEELRLPYNDMHPWVDLGRRAPHLLPECRANPGVSHSAGSDGGGGGITTTTGVSSFPATTSRGSIGMPSTACVR
jgi:hypothetical protein